MLDIHLTSPVTRLRLRSGPAASHIDGFADWLHRLADAGRRKKRVGPPP